MSPYDRRRRKGEQTHTSGKSRYGGNIKKHKSDGHTFDSKKEMLRYHELVLLQKAGEISDLEVHPRIELQGRDGPILTPTGRPMVYIADFAYIDRRTGMETIEDVKMGSGHRTETYVMKRAIVQAMGVEILET